VATAFETFVNDELPNRVASTESSQTLNNVPVYTGTSKLTTEKTVEELLALHFTGAITGFLSQTGSGTFGAIQTKLDATTAPASGNDNTEGYSIGSLWIDVTNDKSYFCVDASTGAAVWNDLTAAGGGGEANTASSQGSGPGGAAEIFYQKSGVDLQFNDIKSENDRLTVALDAVTHDIELTVNEGNIVHQNLSGAGTNDHAAIDTHIGDAALQDGSLVEDYITVGHATAKTIKSGGYTIAALLAVSAAVQDNLNTHKGSSDHDGRYYTEAELDAGQLDNRYFRENEFITVSAGSADVGKPIVLDADGHVDATVVNDSNIAHQSTQGAGTHGHGDIDTHLDTVDGNPHGVDLGNIGSGTLAELNTAVTDATLDTSSAKRDPNDHTHQSVGTGGKIDHGLAIDGLTDDDHTQYALLAGRSGGQTIKGGTGSGDDLVIQSTNHATKGVVQIDDLEPRYRNVRIPFQIPTPADGDLVVVYVAGHNGAGAKAPYATIQRIAANVEGTSASITFNGYIRTMDAFHTGGTVVFATAEVVTAYEEWSSFTAADIDSTADGSADECLVIEVTAVGTAADWLNGWVELEIQD
jgi:hypothetical protein